MKIFLMIINISILYSCIYKNEFTSGYINSVPINIETTFSVDCHGSFHNAFPKNLYWNHELTSDELKEINIFLKKSIPVEKDNVSAINAIIDTRCKLFLENKNKKDTICISFNVIGWNDKIFVNKLLTEYLYNLRKLYSERKFMSDKEITSD